MVPPSLSDTASGSPAGSAVGSPSPTGTTRTPSPATFRTIAVWSNPRHTPGTSTNSAADSARMNPTSRSRCSGMTGVCTAPSLASASEAITVSIRVGNCQATRVPAPIPSSRNPAAARSAASRTPSKVTLRPSPS